MIKVNSKCQECSQVCKQSVKEYILRCPNFVKKGVSRQTDEARG